VGGQVRRNRTMGPYVDHTVHRRACPALAIVAVLGAMAACSPVPFVGMHATPTPPTRPSSGPPRLVDIATAWPNVVPLAGRWRSFVRPGRGGSGRWSISPSS